MHAGHGPKKGFFRKLRRLMPGIGSKEPSEIEGLRYHPAQEHAQQEHAHAGYAPELKYHPGAEHAGQGRRYVQLSPLIYHNIEGKYLDMNARLLLGRIKQMKATGIDTRTSPQQIEQIMGVGQFYSRLKATADQINGLEDRLEKGVIPLMNVEKGFSTRHAGPSTTGWTKEISGSRTTYPSINSPAKKHPVTMGVLGHIPIIGGAFTLVGHTLQTVVNIATWPIRKRRTGRKVIETSLKQLRKDFETQRKEFETALRTVRPETFEAFSADLDELVIKPREDKSKLYQKGPYADIAEKAAAKKKAA
ncbi:MAG: hypothetical protein HY392_03730 [Candidatus Diapherotrites archaeon]|nr:hypothetical protein [Candidatus Diapherotrites archaeon]